MGRKRWGFTLF